MTMLRVFIGYDSREPAAYHTFAHSILKHASVPIAVVPLVQQQLREMRLYTRERGPTESTEFSLTRFLVPALCDYQGFALFADCDMLAKADLNELWLQIAYQTQALSKAVLVCQHDYVPKAERKMEGQVQTRYPRKNWSSFMVFDNARCRALTPEYVNGATGLELHRFLWLKDEEIGALPLEWNWLIGEYEPNAQAKILHFTEGGPWFRDYQDCDHAADWRAVHRDLIPPSTFSREAWYAHAATP